ncbi:zinc finger protein ZAT4 [Vigna radiata var. radiata]|uniref:Zinc finger protein ZAT4 n=1 Tax=Vigna radiata var. radiata TaxID=3916 RepID=A0A1S3UPF0_VIGRR|nr:zinc finger protein ZAT4 [Vigna radiata var. radiata]
MDNRHKCKLCSRSFTNGRALGGHMKAHLASLPLPPKPQTLTHSSSFTYSSSSDSQQHHLKEQDSLSYALRENPKKTFRVTDPEDRESETESKNPTRQRSKRNRKSAMLKLSFVVSTPLITEPEPVSSVSDTSPEEDVAMSLMMLSRDTWNVVTNAGPPQRSKRRCTGSETKLKKLRGKYLCHTCGKAFRSSRALGSHKTICCRQVEAQNQNNDNNSIKVFECPFCYKVFGSGQALGGHKRSHLIPSSSSTVNDSLKFKQTFIDLNMPAQPEEDDLSVVSDA